VVARGDLGWWLDDGRLLLVEIDGATPHGAPDALYRDRARQNAIVATGALLLRFTADDLRHHRVAQEVARHVTPSTTRDGAVVRPGSGR
jgi:very-short-patch-repair endonuclease